MKTTLDMLATRISASRLSGGPVSDIRIVMIGGIIMRSMRGAGKQA